MICKCEGRRGASGLYYCPRVKNDVVWVCSDCLMPLIPSFNKYLKKCEDCLDDFSAPWENLCKKCFKLTHSDVKLVDGRVIAVPLPDTPIYRGWAWAAPHERAERQERTEKARAMQVADSDS